MGYNTKSYKRGDGYGVKADRKYQADRAERRTIKKKLYEDKIIHNKGLCEL